MSGNDYTEAGGRGSDQVINTAKDPIVADSSSKWTNHAVRTPDSHGGFVIVGGDYERRER